MPLGVPAAVLDFRRNSKVPNYLGSQHQRRWLLFLAVGGVVAILAFQSGTLSQFLFGPGARDDGLVAMHEPPARDAVVSGNEASRDAAELPAPADRDEYFPGVRKDYLSAVRDDTVFRDDEIDAWFHLLALLDTTDERRLQNASIGRVSFLQLDQQAEWYRGRLVTIGGIVRSAKRLDAPENGFGIEQYYQLWVQPERSSPKLVVVYALNLPAGFPLGASLEAPCTTTGFFFKRWAYQSQEGVTTAPLILARTIDWQPPPVPPPEAPEDEQMVLAFAAALVLAVLIVGYLVVRSRGAARPQTAADSSDVEVAVPLPESPPFPHAVDGAAGEATEN